MDNNIVQKIASDFAMNTNLAYSIRVEALKTLAIIQLNNTIENFINNYNNDNKEMEENE